MAESSNREELHLISKGLYRIVSDVIGPECIVKLRRQRYEVRDLLENCDTAKPTITIISGSMSEGFDFKSSDFDIMYLDKNADVCTNYNRFYMQNLKSTSLFLMDNEECSPGFTLLNCLACDRNNETIFNCLVRKGDAMYLSSKAIRETFMSFSTTELHGPCQTDSTLDKEADYAYTVRCPTWSEQATCFVLRSLQRGWPSKEVLKDICNDGCLFVPINSKQQTCIDLTDLEWRMSFSLAEKKIVYSMNHCQFLCYGLTKLFLNEVIKKCPHINDLLCSYFMKTAVFWEITEHPSDWSIQTFLFKFWNVFRRLIKWVQAGYCPIFFIPENNMFYGKICGDKQRMLLSALRDLYAEGYWCLLRCSSLNKHFTMIISQPDIALMLSCNEEEYLSESYIERERLWVIKQFDRPFPTDDVRRITSILHNTVNINTETELMMCTVRLRVNFLLQKYSESLLLSSKLPSRHFTRNRKQYITLKGANRMQVRSKTYLCMNYLNYAKCTYMSGNYHKTIYMLHFIKHKLQSQPYMYEWSLDDDIVMATRRQGMSYDTLINSFIVSHVEMDSVTTIEELHLECHAKREHTGSNLFFIPPLVFINFMLILCYTRIGDFHRRIDMLEELHTLLHHDDGYHIHLLHKAISMEILGICQQICGDHQAAFQSYINALEDKFNYFKEATKVRINSLYN
ncbi:hypothetical protein FSP39_006045 [Pinctada imbricata]|uniref:Mab-21-like HhH/H2TH-like domain-containing protein n=1 Tax=Pinctada imbricata TaxID=66713 RepID=A0AA88XML6_PINIB|nr:hypothetical protein FSP39_006045 [Pinctada imbricata]